MRQVCAADECAQGGGGVEGDECGAVGSESVEAVGDCGVEESVRWGWEEVEGCAEGECLLFFSGRCLDASAVTRTRGLGKPIHSKH